MTLPALGRSLLIVGAIASSRVQAQPLAGPTKQVHEVTHAVVVDSLVGGGIQAGQIFVATDSTSLALLVSAKVPTTSAGKWETLTCPGSTPGIDGKALTNVGYWVKVELHQSEDKEGWILRVNKSCQFVYDGGEPRGFYEGGSWEIRKLNGFWRIVRTLDRVIT